MEDAPVHIRRSAYTRLVYRGCSDLSEHILVIEKPENGESRFIPVDAAGAAEKD